MTITPIDLQVNIGQVHEVGRAEVAKQGALIDQQHLLDEESNKAANLKKSRLDESQKGDKTSIRDEHKKKDQGKREGESHDKGKDDGKVNPLKDDRRGNLIDVLK